MIINKIYKKMIKCKIFNNNKYKLITSKMNN